MLSFEGKDYRVPANSDSVLRAYYGDYMVLPDEADRIPHAEEYYVMEETKIKDSGSED
jgi:hypothetical protein